MSDEATAAPTQMVTGAKVTLYGRGHQIMLDVWRGSIYLKVNKDKAWVFNKKLSVDGLEVIRQELGKLKDAAPGATRTLTMLEYDRDTKKYVRSYVLKFMKSDALVYGIEVMDNKGASYAAPLMIANNIAVGTDPMQERDRSAIALESLLNRLRYEFPISVMMTTAARPAFNRNDRQGQTGGGSAAPSAPSNGAGWDDAPAE